VRQVKKNNYCFYCIFDQINTALVSIKYLFKKKSMLSHDQFIRIGTSVYEVANL